MPAPVALADLRRHAIARSLFPRVDLAGAIERLGFVQADPIRAPARAQDLVLRHRVADYRAGDLDRRYPALAVEEDFFVNYGFVPRMHQALMHPRVVTPAWSAARRRRARAVLEFVRERGEAHPRDVDAWFAHGAVVNAWGGSSNATTHLLDAMHYRGWLRVVRRDNGIRLYGVRARAEAGDALSPARRLDALVDVVVGQYAPLPQRSLFPLLRRLRYGAPQLGTGSTRRCCARNGASRTRASTAPTGTGRPAKCRRQPATASTTTCGSLRRSILSCGIACASSVSGAGRTASRRTRRREAQARLLRAAAPVARCGHRMGERDDRRTACRRPLSGLWRQGAARARFRRGARARARAHAALSARRPDAVSDVALFRRVWKENGPGAALIKALARVIGRRVLIEGLDDDFPRAPGAPDLSMPTPDDATRWHTGYGGRWKHVLPLPNDRMMLHVGAATVDNFYFVGDAWAQLLSRHIAAGSHVMDVGCGCGRTARFLVNNPHVARYTGFDVFRPYVDWCNRFFGELHGERFAFHPLDVRTERYNPNGTLSCAQARFPARDRDVDLVYAASLFTHLYPADLKAYAGEMHRVLRDGGIAVVSFHDRPDPGEVFSGSEHRADYDAGHFRQLFGDAGFELSEDVGDVCGQRTLVLRKVASI